MDEKELSDEEMFKLTRYLNHQVIELSRPFPKKCMIDVAISCLSCYAAKSDENKKEIIERIESASKGFVEELAKGMVAEIMRKRND